MSFLSEIPFLYSLFNIQFIEYIMCVSLQVLETKKLQISVSHFSIFRNSEFLSGFQSSEF